MQLHGENTLRHNTVDTAKTRAVPATAARRDEDTCAFKCNYGSYNMNSEWPLLTPIGVSTQSYKEYCDCHKRLRVTGCVWRPHTSFIFIFNILLLKIGRSTDIESRQSNKESAI